MVNNMEIRLSKTLELVKFINGLMHSTGSSTQLCIAKVFKHPGLVEDKQTLTEHMFDLDQEDLEYLYNKYKPKVLETLEGLKDYVEELKIGL